MILLTGEVPSLGAGGGGRMVPGGAWFGGCLVPGGGGCLVSGVHGLRGCMVWGVCLVENPPEMATAAGGMPPTGMHPCLHLSAILFTGGREVSVQGGVTETPLPVR